jgi:hypothetical protein
MVSFWMAPVFYGPRSQDTGRANRTAGSNLAKGSPAQLWASFQLSGKRLIGTYLGRARSCSPPNCNQTAEDTSKCREYSADCLLYPVEKHRRTCPVVPEKPREQI